jgi:hypothetical protein
MRVRIYNLRYAVSIGQQNYILFGKYVPPPEEESGQVSILHKKSLLNGGSKGFLLYPAEAKEGFYATA